MSERHLFDIPEDVAYFNCAYNAPQLNATREALLRAARAKSHPWERTPASFFDDAEAIRRLLAQVLGGDAEGYAVVPSASYGVSTAARAVQPFLKPGDEILVLAEDFPSNYLPWRRAAQEAGATIVTAGPPGSQGWAHAIVERISPRTRVVAAGNCHWTNGALVDLVAVGEACRRVRAVLALDATQTLGAMPLDIDAIRPDFLVAAGYKWMLWPYGVTLLYVAPRWRGARPLEETWISRDNAADFTSLADYSDVYMPGARRFEVGEMCTALLPGAIAALEQLKAWTVPRIAARLGRINERIAARLEACGFTLPEASQRCPHMLGARLPEGFKGDFVGQLRARGVFVSQRASSVRFAPHLHVDDGDLARLFEAVEKMC